MTSDWSVALRELREHIKDIRKVAALAIEKAREKERELMPCGHPRACLVMSDLPDFIGGRVEEQEVCTAYCGACAREVRKVEDEREACAEIAEAHCSPYQDWGGNAATETALAIARAIRSREGGLYQE